MPKTARILILTAFAVFFLNAFGSVSAVDINNCTAISTAGEIYNLTQDIINSSDTICMNITGDNVTLDCGGRRIDGTFTSDTYGIYVKGRDNVTIRNCTVSDWWYGAHMNYSYRINASAINFSHNNFGIQAFNSWNSSLTDSFLDSVDTGIYMSNCSYNYIGRSIIKNGGTGMSFYLSSSNNTIFGSRFETLGIYALYISQSYDNFFVDSNISTTVTNVYHFASSDTVFLNVSLDKTAITVVAGAVYVKWYLDTRVLSQEGSPLNQANVTIRNVYNTTLFSGQTDASGYAQRQNATDFHQNFSGKFYYSNYIINATRTGYVDNQTSANVTANMLAIVRLPGIPAPYVDVKTYTLGLVEEDKFKPNRPVRVRAFVNYTMGRDYIKNATVLIRNNLGSVVVNNQLMTKISNITNGYLYEYNYSIPGSAESLWTVNVTSTTDFNSKGYGSKKIAIIPLTLQIKLVLNSTSDTFYIPNSGGAEVGFSGLTTAQYSTPDHYYIAAYQSDLLKAVVSSGASPVAIFTEKGSATYGIGISQRFSGSMFFIAFSKGNWRAINNKIGSVERDEFLASPEPSFSFGSGAGRMKIVLEYDNIDLNKTLTLWRGYSRLVIEKTGTAGAKAALDISRS